MEKLFFNKCVVEVWPENGYTQTLFDDGTKVPAFPNETESYLHTMKELGYEQPKIMTMHHEILHTFLAEAEGLEYSPTLWAVAHKDEYNPEKYNDYLYEEATVLSFQKYLNDLPKDPILAEMAEKYRWNLRLLKKDAKNLLDFTF